MIVTYRGPIISCAAGLALAGVSIGAQGPAFAQTTNSLGRDDGRGFRQCHDIQGYLNDEAVGGRAVHAEPDGRSRILGRIAPPFHMADGHRWPVSFRLIASRDGWLLVERAGDDDVLTEGVARPMYHGRGWIRGERVSVGIQASQAFPAPSHASEMIVNTGRRHDLESSPMIALVACDGTWIRARWRIGTREGFSYQPEALVTAEPLVVEGWATGICNIQETSCDMQPGNRPE